ncbi:hypothetical protein ACQ5TV_07685 [Acetobacter ghanensis]
MTNEERDELLKATAKAVLELYQNIPKELSEVHSLEVAGSQLAQTLNRIQ